MKGIKYINTNKGHNCHNEQNVFLKSTKRSYVSLMDDDLIFNKKDIIFISSKNAHIAEIAESREIIVNILEIMNEAVQLELNDIKEDSPYDEIWNILKKKPICIISKSRYNQEEKSLTSQHKKISMVGRVIEEDDDNSSQTVTKASDEI